MVDRELIEKARQNYMVFIICGFLGAVVSVQGDTAFLATGYVFSVFLFNGVERSGVSLGGEARTSPEHYRRVAPMAILDTLAIMSGALVFDNFVNTYFPALGKLDNSFGVGFFIAGWISCVILALHIYRYTKRSLLPEESQ
jgi:hypothetical protein